ncbi:MAG: PilN domain-containing protein [Candidatus Saccharimonadales bacterium]
MINLMSPTQKHDIRTARMNVTLLHYCIMFVVLAVVIASIYGIGFWLVMQDKAVIQDKLESESAQSKTYAAVEQEAETFRKNLTVAKRILDNETRYSTFLTTLASDLPSGTLLTSFSIGDAATAATSKGMTLDARATSYAKVLEMKKSLEDSTLFENVSIENASRPDDVSVLTGLEAKYPFEASLNVTLSKAKAGATP